jgi:hypothetical protein
MVLAAPVFLLTQTRAFGVFYRNNREPLLRMGLGAVAVWMGLRALSKSYEASKLSDEVDIGIAKLRAVNAVLADAAVVGAAAEAAGYRVPPPAAAKDLGRPATTAAASPAPSAGLAAALAAAIDDATRRAEFAARAAGGRLPELAHLPQTGRVAEARQRAATGTPTQPAATQRSTGGGGPPAAPAASAQRSSTLV